MIEYINLLLLLTMFRSTCYVYYKLKKFFYIISIVMDSEILDQLTDLGRDVDSEFPKPKRGLKKKADTEMNELEDNDVRDKRERLVACVLSGNSKMYLGKEYTEQQINEMDYNSINTLLTLNRPGGGRIRPQAGSSLCCAETVSSRKLKLSDFYYILIGLNSEYKPVPWDSHCCHGNAIVEGCSVKFWLKSVKNCIFLLKSFSNLSLGLLFVISISKLPPIPNFNQIG